MANVRESIEVNAPIEDCYEAWRNFENFPRFMSHVKEVRVTGNQQHWVAEIMGMKKEWTANLTTEDRPRVIAWQATGEVGMDGNVNFTQIEPRRTRVEVDFNWRGGGVVEGVGQALGIDNMSVKEDLTNFKKFVEGRKMAQTPSR